MSPATAGLTPLLPALRQDWSNELFTALKAAGGRAYSNYAVGYNNVVVPEATKVGIPVGNTPGWWWAGEAGRGSGGEWWWWGWG